MDETNVCGGFKKRGAIFYERCCIAARMRADGATYDKIADALCRSHGTVIHYCKRYREVKEDPRRDRAFAAFIENFEKQQSKTENEMKREIKFRGKSLSGEWRYGDLVHSCVDVHVFPEDGVDSTDNYEVDPTTVGQYTGLKDRKGREIYEGDILNNYDEPNPLIVKWDAGGCFFGLFNLDDDCESDFTSIEVRLGLVVDAEVVGNVHDNPELMEGKE